MRLVGSLLNFNSFPKALWSDESVAIFYVFLDDMDMSLHFCSPSYNHPHSIVRSIHQKSTLSACTRMHSRRRRKLSDDKSTNFTAKAVSVLIYDFALEVVLYCLLLRCWLLLFDLHPFVLYIHVLLMPASLTTCL